MLRQLPGPEKAAAAAAAMGPLIDTKACLERTGIPVEMVSVGATGTYSMSGRYPGVTEIQAGSYLFMDTDYQKMLRRFHSRAYDADHRDQQDRRGARGDRCWA